MTKVLVIVPEVDEASPMAKAAVKHVEHLDWVTAAHVRSAADTSYGHNRLLRDYDVLVFLPMPNNGLTYWQAQVIRAFLNNSGSRVYHLDREGKDGISRVRGLEGFQGLDWDESTTVCSIIGAYLRERDSYEACVLRVMGKGTP